MNVLNLEMFATRLHSGQKAAVYSCGGDSTVDAGYATSYHDSIALRDHIDDLHLPVRKCPKDVLEVGRKYLPALDDALVAFRPGTKMVTHVRREQLTCLLPMSRIHQSKVLADYFAVLVDLRAALGTREHGCSDPGTPSGGVPRFGAVCCGRLIVGRSRCARKLSLV